MSAAPFATERELDPGPFRAWCEKRLLPKAKDWKHGVGELAGRVTVAELAEQLGIDERRLTAWRGENRTLDRDYVEDALHRAGVAFRDVYPDLPEVRLRGSGPQHMPGYRSLLSDSQVRELHALHRRGVPVKALAERVWVRAGYASWQSAEWGIRAGFRRLDLPIIRRRGVFLRGRQCRAERTEGGRCGQFVLSGSDFCWHHHPATRDAALELAERTIVKASRERAAA